jgi:hypothetical protein
MAKKGQTETAEPTKPTEPATAPAASPFPAGFDDIKDAPKDGRTVRLWFGTSAAEMTPKYMVLAKWRHSRKFTGRQWAATGFWCYPHSNLPIGFEFRAFQLLTGVISQEEIDISNQAVEAENKRRQDRLKAQTKPVEQARAS